MPVSLLSVSSWYLAPWVIGGLECAGCGELSAETDRSDPEWRKQERPGWLKADPEYRGGGCCVVCIYRCVNCGAGE